MSQNYDNWERLVAAVVKREQIWQLCHQASFSTICSSSDYSSSELSLPVWLGTSFRINDTFKFVQQLRQGQNRKSDLVQLLQDVQVSDRHFFGTGTKAVIKSLESAEITEDKFDQHMAVLGDCVHENVATPWAYHFSQMTCLMVYSYYSQGSVHDMLQGYGCGPDRDSRVRIAVGAARGLAHIHAQCGGKLVHGNIKSSHIFLNSQHYGCVSIDFGRSDELESSGSQKSDVYSFGILLLQLVTGRSFAHSHYVVNRLRLSELDALDFSGYCLIVDEVDMNRGLQKFSYVDLRIKTHSFSSEEKELRMMLQVAKNCLAELPEDRPTMSQVVLQLQNIKRDLSVVKTDTHQSHQHPISDHKKGVWNRLLPFRR